MTKILVIEDELTVREGIIDTLTAENFQAIGAENGHLGVQLAQQEIPALIICDIMMPLLNGYQVLTTLRSEPTTAIIPLIFLTAKVSQADRRQGMELGADDYLTKPFTIDALLKAVTVRLDKQSALLKNCTAEQQKYKELEKRVQELQQFNETTEQIIQRFSEDLGQSISKINLATNMLKYIPNKVQCKRYLEILQEECEREMKILNDLSELRKVITPENFNRLQEYNLLRGKKS